MKCPYCHSANCVKELIDKMLLERISLAGIARVVGVSERWLQNYVNGKYKSAPQEVEVVKKSLPPDHRM